LHAPALREEEKLGAALTKVRDVPNWRALKMRRSSTIMLGLCLVVAAGCSQQTVTSPLPADLKSGGRISPLVAESPFARLLGAALSFTSLYDFGVSPDGANPFGALLLANGTLYSTTLNGGKDGIGTVFKVSKSGKESVLYNFAGTPDGMYPIAGLVAKNGTFYGTTGYGGKSNNGTVFKVSASGKESILYSFSGVAPDGAIPQASLVAVNGAFYGTTEYGGADSIGAIFKVSASGKESTLYSFSFSGADGRNPVAGLVAAKGTLYGTTLNGGANGIGTVFKVSASGAEQVLYSFSTSPDGANPQAGLVAVNGTLYGTTQYGGPTNNGTIFKVSTTGKESVLYSFKGTPDGANPYAALVVANGTLYGTTYSGGTSGNGTVYKVTKSGKQQVLYSFTGLPYGGRYPTASMISVNGSLYGTTSEGGQNLTGTVFKITP
jgi:uncharacterized repeat protein (TIGR03803 family)